MQGPVFFLPIRQPSFSPRGWRLCGTHGANYASKSANYAGFRKIAEKNVIMFVHIDSDNVILYHYLSLVKV